MRGRAILRLEGIRADEWARSHDRLREGLDAGCPVGLHLALVATPGRVRPRGSELQLDLAPGTLIVGLALLHDSTLLPTPADRVLNRNVRGLLRGLGAGWFGSEHLVIAGRPVGWVGFDRDPGGRVLVEAFIGLDVALATDPPTDMRGRAWASLRELGIDVSIEELAARVLAGHAGFGVHFELG